MLKRKKFLINPRFQLTFIAWMFMTVFVVMGVFYGACSYFFNLYLAQGQKIGLPPGHVFFSFIWDQYHLMQIIFLVSIIIIFFVIFLVGLLLSHRIVGPIHRLKIHFQKIAQGDFTHLELNFRKTDHFQDVSDAYNDHIKALKEVDWASLKK